MRGSSQRIESVTLQRCRRRNEQLEAEIEKLKKLLRRHNKTMEPFPICSDLKSMTQVLREKHGKKEAKAVEKSFNNRQRRFRKLYKETEQAMKEK